MICKECGARLSVRDTTCPHCGAAVPASEGGVGFWDMLDDPVSAIRAADVAQPAPRPERQGQRSEEMAREEPEMKVSSERAGLPVVVSCALSTVCLLGTLVSGFLAVSSANAARADMEKEVSALKEEVKDLKTLVGEVRDTQSSMQLEVVRRPSNVTKPEGYEDVDGSKLFELEVSGKVKSFTWQKMQTETGGWEELYFDEEGINERYSLRLEQDVEAGTTSLAAVGLGYVSGGSYRCVVRGLYGDELSPTATLTVLTRDEAEPEGEGDEAYAEETPEETDAAEAGEEGAEDTDEAAAEGDADASDTDEVVGGVPDEPGDLGEAGVADGEVEQ